MSLVISYWTLSRSLDLEWQVPKSDWFCEVCDKMHCGLLKEDLAASFSQQRRQMPIHSYVASLLSGLAVAAYWVTFFIRESNGSSHPWVISQWLSRKSRTGPAAASDPLILHLMRPCREIILNSLTLGMEVRRSPSMAAVIWITQLPCLC